jgi:hypothetical protein
MKFKKEDVKIEIGDRIKGRKGKHFIEGIVLESTKKPGKPAIFSSWGGFVGVWIETSEGIKTVVNEIEFA